MSFFAKTKAICMLGLAAGLSLATLGSGAALADESEFFKGKTIRFVVGFGPGGGYDLYARMIAPPLSKQLGGTVVVENQPGAGGITALNRVYTSPPDGLTLMIANGSGAALAQLSNQPGVRFDITKVGHLGTVSIEPWVWLVAKNSQINTVEDAFKLGRPVNWSASGPMDGLSDGALFTCEALRLPCKVVTGYKGSRDAALAVTRNEMDSLYIADTSAISYTSAGDSRAIASINRHRSRFYPNVPTIFEATKVPAENAWMIDFHAALEDLSRVIVLPPGMTPERLAFMQKAVQTVLTDKDFIAEGEKSQRYIQFIDAAKTAASVSKVVNNLTDEQQKTVRRIIGGAAQ